MGFLETGIMWNSERGTQNIQFLWVKQWKIPWDVIITTCSLILGDRCAPLVHSQTYLCDGSAVTPGTPARVRQAAAMCLPTSVPHPTQFQGCELRDLDTPCSAPSPIRSQNNFWAFACRLARAQPGLLPPDVHEQMGVNACSQACVGCVAHAFSSVAVKLFHPFAP